MFCVNCSNKDTSVVNSRPHKRQPLVWRRRSCSRCGHLFTTDERPRMHELYEIQDTTTSQIMPFNAGILLISIASSFQHNREKGAVVAWDIMQTVIELLSTECQNNLTTDEITIVTHRCLERFDKAAAMSYALQHHLISGNRKPGRPSLSSASSAGEHVLEKPASPYQSRRTYRDTYRAQDESAR